MRRLKKFISYYKPYKRLFFTDMVCALLVSLTLLALPLCVRYITKNVLEAGLSNALTHIYWMGALMLGLVLLHTACHAFVDYQGHMMGALMEGDMRNELFDHYQKLSFHFYDKHKTGQLMTRISNDTFEMTELFHHGPEDIVISFINCLGAFIILFSINVKLSIILLVFLVIMAFHASYFSRRMRKALKKSNDRIGDINAQVEDSLAGIRVVKSFTNEGVEKEKFSRENSRFIESRREAYKSEAYFYDGLVMFTQLMTIGVVIFGAISIVKATLDLADLITFLLYIALLIEPIQRLGNFTRLYQEGLAGFHRFMEILEVEPDIKDVPDAIELEDAQGDIEFRNVSFQYKEGYRHVLKNLSLHIKSGEYVALVGPSGIGKTTLSSLIPRFYEINNGEILLDGKNIREITLRSLRRNIGIVQQDVYLFAGTVLDNIRYGNPTATKEEIIDAAKKAHAHDFIMALSNDYATDIGQRGVKLSGGQKQRISIARAFLKNPPIIIFDEATSALDYESEKAVQESLERLRVGRTTLVIAHRLSTVRKAEKILVLNDQGIVEQGTHEELIALNGAYAKIYKTQLSI